MCSGGICNAGMPTSRPWDQYVWAVGQALKAGMYVSLDFHGNQYGDQSFYQPDYFISSWQQLLRCESTSTALPHRSPPPLLCLCMQSHPFAGTWGSTASTKGDF